jgi:hypothetical protein
VVRYPRFGVEIVFPTNEASAGAHRIRSASRRYRTPRGIGVGSTRSQVMRAYPGARCSPDACSLTHRRVGFRVETRFVLARARVARVTLQRTFTG